MAVRTVQIPGMPTRVTLAQAVSIAAAASAYTHIDVGVDPANLYQVALNMHEQPRYAAVQNKIRF